tara:strand:+ start:79 stop:546 length:468 start_codon:yes stop_codon:yes gene_type:complete
MKKLLYLLLAITFIGCSSDDNSNEEPANQLFLDIYNGVVWKVTQSDDDGHLNNKITFFNNPDSYIVYYPAPDDLCVTVVFGETYGEADEEQVTITIHNESENSITFKQQETGDDDLYFSFTANSNGNSLIREVDYGNGDIAQDVLIIETNSSSCN